MSLVLVSTKVLPVNLKLALKFRDMQALKGERELKAHRSKKHARLLAEGQFFSPLWGECRRERTLYRGNGNHTSHLLAACLQQTSGKGLDEESQRFVERYLMAPGGDWRISSAEELPPLKDGAINAVVETYTAESQGDLVAFFRRYDAKESSRTAADLLGIHKGDHDDLAGLERKKVGWALAGVLRAAKYNPESFQVAGSALSLYAGDPGAALKEPLIRAAVRWIVETVPDESLYSKLGGAQVFAEVWATHNEEVGERIVAAIMAQIDEGDSIAASWYAALTARRNKPTLEVLIKRGRCAVKEAVHLALKSA